MVDLAISALALAIFSRTQKYVPAANEALLRYGRLLRVASEQITPVRIVSCGDGAFDEFLVTIILMAWYETTMHQPASLEPKSALSSLHSWSHHDGAIAILKVWNDKLGKNAPSNIIQQSRRGLLRSALLRNFSLPTWMRDGSRFGEHALDLGFDNLLVRVVNLRHTFKGMEQNKRPEILEAEDLINEAATIDEACQEWVMQFPGEWSYQSYRIPRSWPRKEFYSGALDVYVYARHGYAAVWIQYFALRMLINSTLLSLLQISCLPGVQVYNSHYLQQRLRYKTRLKFMGDSLASTIPFSLGRFTTDIPGALDPQPIVTLNIDKDITPAFGLPTIWPLSMASSFKSVQSSQQMWFCSQLARLGTVLGDGALMCAGTDL